MIFKKFELHRAHVQSVLCVPEQAVRWFNSPRMGLAVNDCMTY